MIKLKDILSEAESFTAINKDTGKVSVFKSKDARDSAIKKGTHDKKKAAKGGDSSAKKDKPKVNIFDKPKKDKAAKGSDSSAEKIDNAYDAKDFEPIVSSLKGKIDDQEYKEISGEMEALGNMQMDMQDLEDDGEDTYNEKMEIDSAVEDLQGRIKQALSKDKKSEPKKYKATEPPKLSKDDDGEMSIAAANQTKLYLNQELDMDGVVDINSIGAIEYGIQGSESYILIGDDEIGGKKFSVEFYKDGDETGDTYKSFDNSADAMAYAKELGKKLKGGAGDTPKSDSSEKAPRDEKNRIIVPKELGLKGDRFNDDWYQKTFAWVTNKEQQKVVNDLIKKSSPQVVDRMATRGLSGSQIRDGEHSKAFQDSIQKILDKRGGSYNPEDEKSSDEPSKDSANSRPGKPEVNKAVRKKAESLGITPQKLGKEEYESRMSKAAIEALTDSNFHSEARKLIAVLEDKPEWEKDPRQDPNMPDIFSPEYEEWQKTSVYSSELYDSAEGTDEIAHEASNQAGWDGVAALDAIAYDLKMNGSKKLAAKIQGIIDDTNESSTQLRKLVPEQHQINEGTRSQVGIIDRSGKIASGYVHYDGYPSNMKKGLKKHMKNEKDILQLIKKGGARGIYNNKDIEYFNEKPSPIKGNFKNIEKYIKSADRSGGAEFVYLYNMKDKKWYFADTYHETELTKLY